MRVLITPSGQILGAGEFPLSDLPSTLLFENGTVTVSAPVIVPLQPVTSQILNVTLNQQACTIKLTFKQIMVPSEMPIPVEPPVYEQIDPAFLDLYVNGGLIIGGVICQNQNLIVRDVYLGFSGDLAFVDTQPSPGTQGEDPQVVGLGSRFLLTYWPDLN